MLFKLLNAEFFESMRKDPADLLIVETVADALRGTSERVDPLDYTKIYADFVDDLRSLGVPLLFWTGFVLPTRTIGPAEDLSGLWHNGTRTALLQESVLRARNVPFLSLQRLAWPSPERWQSAAELWRPGLPGTNKDVIIHPDSRTHHFVAEGLAGMLLGAAACGSACAPSQNTSRSAHRCARSPVRTRMNNIE